MSTHPGIEKPRDFRGFSGFGGRTRWVALFVLTAINLLNYIDRYIFSALLPAIKEDLRFTDTQLGILGSAFLFAYMFASPVFGLLGDRGGRSRLMSFGVGIWSVATGFSGICTSFSGQLLTRAAVGLGESAYSVIAPSSIADYFSKRARGRVFAVYSGAIPVGSALGYVIGGILEPRVGWHKAFFVVGFPGLLLALLLFFLPDPARGAAEADGDLHSHEPMSIRYVYRSLLANGGFVTTVLGYAAYTFVVGGMAFWMPMYLVRYFDVSLEKANVQFGALTVVGGFLGTLLGGVWADRVERRSGNGFLKVSFFSMVLSVPLFFLALSIGDYSSFMASLFFLEVALFLCISPLDAAVIGYVRPAWRATAMALSVFLIHLLGDGISRTLMGMMSDATDLRSALLMLPWALVVAGIFWLFGFVFFWQPVRWPDGGFSIPRWQAHRGYRPDGVVENTIQAFREAKRAGAEMSECDVQLSADGVAVVFHDPNLRRIANRDERVANLTASEMKSLAGAPTLDELLKDALAPRYLNIELKSGDVLRSSGLEEAVLKSVRNADAERRVLLSSFNPFTLHRLARLAPDIPRALIASDVSERDNAFYLRRLLLGFWARPHILNLDEKMLSRDRLQRYRDRGLRIYAWTVNDRSRAQEVLAMGADGVISDRLFGES